jgi:polyprenyl-phospho-N-acetylgalactosaminyl synthase
MIIATVNLLRRDMHQDVCVIVPVYNEATVIKSVITQLEQYFTSIVCVDDGSKDGSMAEINETKAILVRHKTNYGQGAALRTGIRKALENPKIRYFMTFDADGQHTPSDALKLAQNIKHWHGDVILGSRFLGSAEGLGWIKRVFLKLAIVFTNRTTGLQLTDTHNGLRIFNRHFAQQLSQMRCNGMAHASEIIYKIREGNFSYSELPVTIRYTDYSKSKGQSMLNTFSILRELFAQRN